MHLLGIFFQLQMNTFGVLVSIYSWKTVYVRLIELNCSGDRGFAAGLVHNSTLLCFHASALACFCKLGACCPKATAGNSLTADNYLKQPHLKKIQTTPVIPFGQQQFVLINNSK